MGTIRVRVERNEATAPETAGEGQRETREIWGSGSGGAAVVPFDTAELAESLRGLSTQLGDLFAGMGTK